VTLDEMVCEMVDNDLDQARQHALLKRHGFAVTASQEK
jgi:GDPmannose 4,6-dehydratase